MLQLDAKATEEEDRMAEYRRDLFIVLRSISKIAPEVTRGFVQSNLLTVLGNKDASAEDVEVRLPKPWRHFLYSE